MRISDWSSDVCSSDLNCFSYYEFSTASVQWTRAGDGCRRERTEAWSFRHGRRNIVMRARNSYRSADRRAALVRDLMLTAGAVVGLCGAGQAYAQTAQPQTGQAEQGADELIVVTGYRESIERRLEQKRTAHHYIDVINAEHGKA